MLEVADVCILCGEVHPARQFGFNHGEHGQCPKVIMGRFPMISQPPADDVLLETPVRGSASKRIRDFETPSSPAERTDSRFGVDSSTRPRPMGLPWLPPPDLGAVI